MPDEAADMAAHLLAGGRLAGAEHDRHRPAGRGVVDVDRQEAVGIVVGVEQRQLLAAVDLVAGVVNVERDARRRRGVARHPLVDEGIGQTDRIADSRRVLEPRQGRLRGKSGSLSGRRPQASLKAGSQRSVSKSLQSSYPQAIANMRARIMSYTLWITRVTSRASGNSAASRAAIPSWRSASHSSITPPSDERRPPSKAAVTFFPRIAGNENGRWLWFGMAAVAEQASGQGFVLTPNPTLYQRLSYTRQPPSWPLVNNPG